MEITGIYMGRGFTFGTPVIPIKVDLPSATNVGSLKHIMCYATDSIEDTMAIILPKDCALD